MTERPTPETDAMLHADWNGLEEYSAPLSAYRRMTALCRTLERERDAAREPLGFFDATNAFIDSGLLHYANHSAKGLTQVFMHGPFAGWSERKVIELIQQLDKNRKLYRLEP